jgi:hypothetical protein
MRAALVFVLAIVIAPPCAAQLPRWRGEVEPAPAAAPPPVPVKATDDYLSRMDADGDGKVSLREYQTWLSYAFDRMDANRDGTLSPEEQPGGRGASLAREAHLARVAETFKRQDRNRDGTLDAKELAAPPQGK